MKKLFTTMFCMAVIALSADAQKFSPEAFREGMEKYLVENAKLSEQEAKAVLPILNEMHEQSRNINEQMRQVKRGVDENATAQQAEESVNKLSELMVAECALKVDYYKKLCATVSANKVMQVIKAEDNFHREILRKGSGFGGNGRGRGMRNRSQD